MDTSYSYWLLSTGGVRVADGIGKGGGRSGSGWLSNNNKPLDPNAKSWSPKIYPAPEEDRCLFMTFSNGHSITEHEIYRFFTQTYGNVLERVYVHRPPNPPPNPNDETHDNKIIRTPQFGKVVFKTSWIPLVMTYCGRRQTKFIVNGKPLWCKKFDPRKTHAFKNKINEIGSSSTSTP